MREGAGGLTATGGSHGVRRLPHQPVRGCGACVRGVWKPQVQAAARRNTSLQTRGRSHTTLTHKLGRLSESSRNRGAGQPRRAGGGKPGRAGGVCRHPGVFDRPSSAESAPDPAQQRAAAARPNASVPGAPLACNQAAAPRRPSIVGAVPGGRPPAVAAPAGAFWVIPELLAAILARHGAGIPPDPTATASRRSLAVPQDEPHAPPAAPAGPRGSRGARPRPAPPSVALFPLLCHQTKLREPAHRRNSPKSRAGLRTRGTWSDTAE